MLVLIIAIAAFSVAWIRYHSPLYQSHVTVAFITKTNKFHGEVYDHFTDNHIYTAQAAVRLFENPSTRRRLITAGGTADFTFELAHAGNQEVPVYSQPYVTMRAVSSDPRSSFNTLNVALGILTESLERWQAESGADGNVMIEWQPIAAMRGPERQSLEQKRAMAGVLIIGAIAMGVFIGAVRRRHVA